MVLNKLVSAFFISFALLATAPTTMAKPAGKIENKSPAETVISIDETVEGAEALLAAIKNGEEKESVMAMFKALKNKAKTIESTVTYMIRERSLGRLKKSRSAFKKDKTEEAEELMEKTLESFKKLKDKYHNF
jgi:prophage DNA circulation protein